MKNGVFTGKDESKGEEVGKTSTIIMTEYTFPNTQSLVHLKLLRK